MTVARCGQYEDQQKFYTWRCGEADLDYWPNLRLTTKFKIHVPKEAHDENHWDPLGHYSFIVEKDSLEPIIPSLTFEDVDVSFSDSEDSETADSSSLFKVPITPRV